MNLLESKPNSQKAVNRHDRYRPDIDGLRAMAIIPVIGFHAFPEWFKGGFVGVDIFFVISGFLITNNILTAATAARFSFVEFYSRRIKRIFPALIVVLVACYSFGWFVLLADEFKQLNLHIVAASAFASNFLLWEQSGYFDVASESKPLLHIWSLGIEEQFYILWPLTVLALRKFQSNFMRSILAIFAISFFLNVAWVGSHPIATFYNPASRFWELLTGCLLAYALVPEEHAKFPCILPHWSAPAPLINHVVGFFGALCIVLAITVLDKTTAFPGGWALLPTVGALCLIWAGPNSWFNQRILGHPAIVFVGLISYPLYLWHWPLLSFSRVINTGETSWQTRLGIVLLSVLLAWLTYVLIERPVRFSAFRAVPVWLCSALAMVCTVAIGTILLDGIPERYPRAIQKLDSYSLSSGNITREWRRFKCMLEDQAEFASECLDTAPAGAPLVVIWGDSHAAALYPGLRALSGEYKFRIGQFNTSRCPPIVGFQTENPRLNNPNCLGINKSVLTTIKAASPQIIIMTAYWNIYDTSNLADTIAELQKLGIPKIILVGSAPVWSGNPARIVFERFKSDPLHRVPQQVGFNQISDQREVDAKIIAVARKTSVEFVSVVDALCDTTGCQAFAGASGDELTFSDSDHLSPVASILFVRQKLQSLLEDQLSSASSSPK
jgi:peptidoglycan/LPS O-acetylase OafA/YrhL